MDPGNFEISLEKGEREFEREESNVTNKSKWKKLRGENILMKVIIKWSSDEQWKLRNDIRNNMSWYMK